MSAHPPSPSRVAVVVEAPQHSGLWGALDYLSTQPLQPGTLVRVPLGRRVVTGVVWQAGADSAAGEVAEQDLKAVIEVLDGLPPLPDAWRQLVKFASAYYQRSLGEMALMVLPPELRQLDALQWGRRLKRLDKVISPPEATPKRRRKASAEVPPEPACTQEPPASAAVPLPPVPLPVLTEQQAQALAQLAIAGGPPGDKPFLLWGSTGSGKTEVYLRQAQRALDEGRQVLMMVPEINLTPQLEARVAERFAGRHIVSLHSGLTPAQRLRNWLMAHYGHADLILGTRLSVFTPLPRLGLIVVDEEHDPSYKQQDGARYSARDLAVYRARLEKVPVILGSATPSLESWYNALPEAEGGAGRYVRLAMPARVGDGDMPRVRVLDLSRAPKLPRGQEPPPVARELLAAITQRIEQGEQSLVLLNRRGYAPVLHCSDCGWKSGCPHCSAWRVFHKVDRTLRCHHCGFTERVPRACPDCGNTDIHPVGRGTERLEEQLAEALPGARVGRIDADVTKHKGALEERLATVHAGEVDVLVGTQMVAKGHDFRRITLVAAVNPDAALFASDFRAAERQFALLLQAAGRAGRDADVAGHSEMWVQTWHPTHPLYQALSRYDYADFAAQQLKEREMAGLPPYASLAMLRAEAKTQEAAVAFLNEAIEAVAHLAEALGGITLYPPVPTPVQRVANVERAQLMVESPSRPALQRFLSQSQAVWLALAQKNRRSGLIRWAVDVDPLSI
ncbi:primosomal protein N' [Aquabacterium sp. NJ1]|uniref:replication restart helicase PriA n=1 Tax=Aquabacterium sp. NJ1 TaxID=1538295 RepID=UPI00052CC0C9|nr:primosomal protein N' [Aquabacterium sp. NJ1]KGM40545.1 primosomal protein N' [Aquabacterium sp. NJ1]